MGCERLRDDLPGALAEAKALGANWVVCPWIPHGKKFTRDDALRSAEAFNRFGKGARDAGMRFGYHCHGYEFVPSPEGTLFDTLVGATDPATVAFQIDVFHAYHGGANLVPVIEKLGARAASLHLKDLKKGFPVEPGAGTAPAEADVPLGSGQIDYPAVLRAAMKAGASQYYVEDESTDPLGQHPEERRLPRRPEALTPNGEKKGTFRRGFRGNRHEWLGTERETGWTGQDSAEARWDGASTSERRPS